MKSKPPKDSLSHDDIGYEAESAPREPRAVAKKPPRGGRVSSGLALILSVIALSATAYLWYEIVYERPALLATDMPAELTRLDGSTNELRQSLSKTDESVTGLQETQDTLKLALEKIQSDLGRNRTEWVISEAEQLMLAANRRLQLARDVNAALAALRAADRQLELLANPGLLPVRRQLSREIALLESIERADIAGISLKLGSIADSVERLPLAQELRALADPAAKPEGDTTVGGVWHDLLGLVRVRRHDGPSRPLLPPEQQYFARENLRLMLYGAQHAVLQGNVATYHQNVSAALRWLRDYYDLQSQPVATVQADLEKIRATPMMADLPDITTSLDLLRKLPGRQRNS
jgi:uroporphyrin-III C-methyltransferase